MGKDMLFTHLVSNTHVRLSPVHEHSYPAWVLLPCAKSSPQKTVPHPPSLLS